MWVFSGFNAKSVNDGAGPTVGLMFLCKQVKRTPPDSCCANCKTGQQTDRSRSSHSLQPLWLTALVTVTFAYSTEPVNGHLLVADTHGSSVRRLRWNSIPDWVLRAFLRRLLLLLFFKAAAGGTSVMRDALRAGIHTDASLMCDQAEGQRTSVERGQRSLPPPQRTLSAPSTPTSSLYCAASTRKTPR